MSDAEIPSLIYFSCMCAVSLLLNGFILVTSLLPSTRGEFKWVFLGCSISNCTLSLSLLALMPHTAPNRMSGEVFFVFTANPAMKLLGRETCSFVFTFLYVRQTHANLLIICVVPLNRFVHVCWKKINVPGKLWVAIALIPNFVPVIVILIAQCYGLTSYLDLNPGDLSLIDPTIRDSMCAMLSHKQQLGDSILALSVLVYPLFSYSITAYCFVKLLCFVRGSQRNVRSSVSQQVIARQRSILSAITVQSLAPLIMYLPLFIVAVVADRDHKDFDENYTVFYVNLIHYVIIWSPTIDAIATIVCLKQAFVRPFSRQQVCVQNAPNSQIGSVRFCLLTSRVSERKRLSAYADDLFPEAADG